mmetsp:Transcript_7187/g.10579  ORF Transcript_7187/g.10579 Transcript_7187/m.10579 type:complete len:410 (-) Transcript_7187:979-2208(-)
MVSVQDRKRYERVIQNIFINDENAIDCIYASKFNKSQKRNNAQFIVVVDNQMRESFKNNMSREEYAEAKAKFQILKLYEWKENQYERVKKLAAADELEAARLSKSMVEFQMSLLEVMENEIKKKYPEKKLDQYKEHRSDYKKQLSKIIQELQFTSVLYIKAKQSMVGMDLQLTLLREYLVKRGSEHEKAYSLAVEMHKVHSLFKGGNVRIRMILPMAAVILLKTDMKRHEARKALNEIAILSPQFDADWFSFFNYVIEMPHILEYHYETKNKQNKQQLIIKSNPSTPTGSPIQSARNSPTEEKRALANILQATTIQEGHPILKQHLDSMGGKTHSVCDIFSLITNQLEDMQGFEKFVSDSGLMVNDEPVKAIQRSYNFQRCYYDLPVWCRMIIDGRFKNVVDHLEEQQP